MKPKTLIVEQTPEAPVPTAILASSIVKISEGFEKLTKGGLNRRALVVLLKDSTGVSQYNIGRVLDALPQLKDDYCSKRKGGK